VDPLFRATVRGDPWRTGWPAARPIVLLASTFTPSLSAAGFVRDRVAELAARGSWNWLVTLHPKMAPEVVRSYRDLAGPTLRFVETDDVLPLLVAADVMVSDTSSIAHEFLLLHKPVVTLRNARPGPYLIDVRDPAELEPAIVRALERPPEILERIVEFARRVHPYRDGRSSERVLEATRELAAVHPRGLPGKPLNAWRKLRIRARLGYWRWR
jgi:CDP-glycerol glycerophosphotransferase (TagB/SpsB family)